MTDGYAMGITQSNALNGTFAGRHDPLANSEKQVFKITPKKWGDVDFSRKNFPEEAEKIVYELWHQDGRYVYAPPVPEKWIEEKLLQTLSELPFGEWVMVRPVHKQRAWVFAKTADGPCVGS